MESGFEVPVAAHLHGREENNEQMVTKNFQKATELYSSQFVCCLSTSDGKKYTVALVSNSASGRSVRNMCALRGRRVNRGDRHPTTQFHG